MNIVAVGTFDLTVGLDSSDSTFDDDDFDVADGPVLIYSVRLSLPLPGRRRSAAAPIWHCDF